MRGGKRAGAGRPQKEKSDARPQHQMRAYPREWQIIKQFAEIVKLGYDNYADEALQNLINVLDKRFPPEDGEISFAQMCANISNEIENQEIEKDRRINGEPLNFG